MGIRAACILVAVLAVAHVALADDGRSEYELGRKAERAGRLLDAYVHYQAARASAPAELAFARAAQRLQLSAAQSLAGAGRLAEAQQLDPAGRYLPDEESEPTADAEEFDPYDFRNLRPPIELQYLREIDDFEFRGALREAYERIGERFGVRVLFDEGVGQDNPVRFDLDEADFPRVILAIGDVTKTFVVPVTSKMILVAEDTAAKRQELEPVAAMTIPIPEAMTAEESQQVVQSIQQTLDVKRAFVSASTQQLLLRATVSQLRLAKALAENLMQPTGEVMIEVDLIALNRDWRRTSGVTLPTSFPMTTFSTIFNAQVPELDASSAASMIGVGGGDSTFGFTVGDALLTSTLNSGDGRLLQRFQLRAASGMEADLRIGERFPIVNARYSGAVTDQNTQDAIDSGQFIQPIPSFTFEDLGLTFTVTPTVHSSDEVTLKLLAEFKVLAGGSVNGVPILANRSIETQVRLEEGESALISGMSVYEERTNQTGTAGLSEIPIIGRLFREKTVQFNQSDLVMLVRPRVVRAPPGETLPPLTLRHGPEERPLPAL